MADEKSLKNYLKNIAETKIEKVQKDQVLIESQIPKGNKVLLVETSVLFIDMRGSTKLSNKINITNMTKVYKMFSVIASMAVRENHGMIFQFAGDGFMAAFNKTNNANFRENAFNAVIRFKELIDDVYKTTVDEKWHFDCGYAISTGHIFMTRLKSKPFKLHSFGIFPGGATNLSSKLCNLAEPNELLIDEKTYEHLKKFSDFDLFKSEELGLEYYSCRLDE